MFFHIYPSVLHTFLTFFLLCTYHHSHMLKFLPSSISSSFTFTSHLVLWSFMNSSTLFLPTLIFNLIQSHAGSNLFKICWRWSSHSTINTVSSPYNICYISHPLSPLYFRFTPIRVVLTFTFITTMWSKLLKSHGDITYPYLSHLFPPKKNYSTPPHTYFTRIL